MLILDFISYSEIYSLLVVGRWCKQRVTCVQSYRRQRHILHRYTYKANHYTILQLNDLLPFLLYSLPLPLLLTKPSFKHLRQDLII